MAETTAKKPKANVTNLYFGASLLILILVTVLLVFMLRGQSTVNLEARVIVGDTEALTLNAQTQERLLEEYQESLELSPTENILPAGENINQITRDFDDYFSSLPGEVVNSVLTFTEFKADEATGLMYTDASLTISSSEANFFDFLRYVETSGLSNGDNRRLMEVRSISITFADNNAEGDQLNYRIILRIYSSPNEANG